MSDTIDNRIVSLEFDNSKYDKNVNKSIKTTEKLEDALEFKDVESNFNKLNKTIAKVTFSPIEKGIDSVYAKFTMLERFTIQAYDRIANHIIDIGKNIMNEAFMVPRKTGLTEYEQKMDAIQVMLTGSGESLDTVNAKIAELNKYADDTIYSFSDMTQNVGKFINAGVSLDDAVIAIKGISNEAALSGANAQEASRAMYNLAQSLSMGYVATKDWMSIENANMATMSFKEQLIETAEELGVLSKVGDGVWQTAGGLQVTAENLRETLSGKWLSSDVLIKTLTKYGDSTTDIGKKASQAATEVRTFSKMVDTLKEALQSGWGNTWELIIGNFEEAKALWTSISNVLGGMIDKMASSRNEMVKLWKESGGRTAALNGFANAWKNLTAILGAIREAFRTVFPPMTGDKLTEFSIKFEKLTRKLTPSAQTLDKVKRAFTGLFSVLGIVSDAAKAFVSALVSMFSHIKKTDGGILNAAASLGDWLTNLRQTIKEGRVFETVFGGLAKGLSVAINAVKMIGKFIKDLILAFKEKGFTGAFEVIKHGFTALVNHISDELNGFNPIDKVKEIGKNIANTIENWPVIGTVYKFLVSIKNAFANSNVFSFIVGLFKGLVNGVKNAVNEFRNVDTSATDDFTGRLSKKFEPIMGAFTILKNFLANFFKLAKSLLKFIGVVGAQIFDVLSNVFDTLTNSFGDMTAKDAGITFATGSLGVLLLSIAKGMKSISGILGNVQSITGNIAKCFNALTTMINAEALNKIAKAIAVLTVSLLVLSAIPVNQLSASTAVITALFFNLMNIMTSYARAMGMTSKISVGAEGLSSEGSGGALAGMGAQLLLIASAIAILVAAMVVISLLDYESLVKGTAVLMLLLEAITSMSKQLMHGYDITSEDRSSSTKALKMGGNLLALGITISMIVGAFIKLLVVLAIMNKVAGKKQTLKLLAEAGVILGLMMAGIAVILIAVGKAVEFTSKAGTETKGTAAGGGALIGTILAVGFMITQIVGAFTIMLAAIALLYQFGDIDALDKATETMFNLGAGLLLFIAAIAGIVTGFLKINSKDLKLGDAVKSMGSLLGMILVMMNALTVLMAAVGGLALIAHLDPKSFEEARTTIIAIMGALVAILVANGNGIESVKKYAVGILAFAAAISIIAGAFIEVSKLGWKDILKAAGVIVFVMGVLAGFGEIIGNSDKMAKGIGKLTGLLKGLAIVIGIVAASFLAVQLALKIMSSFTDEELVAAEENLSEFLKYMKSAAPEFAEAIAAVLVGVLQTVVESWLGLVSEQVSQIMDFLVTTLDQLVQYAPSILANIWKLVAEVLKSIEKKAPEIVDQLIITLISIINGFASAIDEHRKEILDAIDRLFDSVAKVIAEGMARLLGLEGKSLEGFTKIFGKMASKVLKWITAIVVALKALNIAKSINTALSGVLGNLKYLSGNIKDAGGVWSYFSQKASYALGGLKAKISEMSTFSKFALGAGIAVAVGTAIASIIDKATEAIDVGQTMSEEFKERSEEIRESINETKKDIGDLNKTYTDIDTDYDNAEKTLEKLRSCVDANGKIKKGMEDQAEYLAGKFAEAIGGRYEIEEGILTLYTAMNTQLNLQDDILEKLMAKEKLRAKLNAGRDEIEELRQEIRLDVSEDQQSQVVKDLIAAKKSVEEAVEPDEKRRAEEDYEAALKAYKARVAQIEAFDAAEEAYLNGSQEQIEKASDDLDRGLTSTTTNMFAVGYAIDEVKSAQENLNRVWEDTGLSAEEYRQQMQDLNVQLKEYQDIMESITKTKGNRKLFTRLYDTGGYEDVDYTYAEYAARNYGIGEFTGVSALRAGGAGNRGKEAVKWFKETQLKGYSDKVASINMDSLARSARDAGPDVEKAFTEMGDLSSEGFINALNDNSNASHDAAVNFCIVFQKAFEEEMDMHSPSKVTYGYGEYTVLGFINAIDAMKNDIYNAAHSIAEIISAAFSLPINQSSSLNSIIPVVYDYQLRTSGSYPDLRSLNTNGYMDINTSGQMTAQLADSQYLQAFNRSQNDILDAMAFIQEEIAELKNEMMDISIVMDSGALVGSIAGQMDSALGRRASIKRRGG